MPPLFFKPAVVVVAALLACAFAPLASGSPASRAKKAASAQKAAEAVKMESMAVMLQNLATSMADQKISASSEQQTPKTSATSAQPAGGAMPGRMPQPNGVPDAQGGGLATHPDQLSPEARAWKAVAAQRQAAGQLSGTQAGMMSTPTGATKLNAWNPSQGENQASDQLNMDADQGNKMPAPTDIAAAKAEAEEAREEETDHKKTNSEKESKASDKSSTGRSSMVLGMASRLSGSVNETYLWVGTILIVIMVGIMGTAMAVSACIFNSKYEKTVACSDGKLARIKLQAQAHYRKHGVIPSGSPNKV